MSRTQTSSPTWITRRMCLGCGYDGRELQGDHGEITYNCPSCGHDLYARPPMSYAQMEGLAQPPRVIRTPVVRVVAPAPALVKLDRRLARLETAIVWCAGVVLLSIVTAGVLQHIMG